MPEQVIHKSTEVEAMHVALNEYPDENDLNKRWRVAKIIRKEVLLKNWKFHGSMDDFELPPLLS